MDDSELLQKYEPVLRFAKSERFFPMAVEPYLERCTLLPSGPQGIPGMLVRLSEPLIARIGKLNSGEYYLRFVNDPLIDSDIWVWWGILSAAALGHGGAARFAFPSVTHSRKSSYLNSRMSATGVGW